MMRIDKLLYGILIAIFCFSSCYEDKGDYDYKNMKENEVSVRFKKHTITPFYGEPAVLTPIFKYYNKGADTTIYKFDYWFEKYGTVSTERNLNHVFEGETGFVDGLFIVTDTLTKMKWMTPVSVSYQSPYAKGWFILSDEEGTSRINVVRLKNEEYITDQRLYSTLHGEDLGKQPYRLFLNTRGMNWGEARELRVLQYGPEGSVSLNPKDFKKIKTLASEFAQGQEPAGFKPVSMGFSANAGVVVGENGNLYTRTYESQKLNYSSFVDVPMEYNLRKLDVQYVLSDHPIQDIYNILVYDRVTSRFIKIEAASYYGAGVPSVVNPPAVLPAGVPSPDKLTGYENLYSQLYNTSWYTTGVFALLKNSDGKMLEYSFSYDTNDEICTDLVMKEFTGSSLINKDTKLHRLRNRPYLFIGSGNELYYYDLNTHTVYPYKKDFAGKITTIESDYTNKDAVIGVGLDNGEFFLLDVSEDVFMDGIIPEPIYSTRVPGKVVDCLCK